MTSSNRDALAGSEIAQRSGRAYARLHARSVSMASATAETHFAAYSALPQVLIAVRLLAPPGALIAKLDALRKSWHAVAPEHCRGSLRYLLPGELWRVSLADGPHRSRSARRR